METQFNSSNLKVIRAKLDKVLSDFGKENGISFKTGGISYTGETFRVTLNAVRQGPAGTPPVRPEAAAFRATMQSISPLHGLKINDLGREFTLNGSRYTFEGYRPSAKKNDALIKRVSDGKEFCTSLFSVGQAIKQEDIRLDSQATAIAEAVGNAKHRV